MSGGDSRVLELTAVREGKRWVIEGDHVYAGMDDASWLPNRAAPSKADTGKNTGILAHVQENPPRASFVEGTRVEVVNLGSGQAATLRGRGLGSRWTYFSRQGQLQSLASDGSDAAACGALAMLNRFVQLVNTKKYAEAWKLLTRKKQQDEELPTFTSNYQGRFLAEHRDDVKLIEVLPTRVVARVRFAYKGEHDQYIEFPCVLEGGQWRLDDCLVVMDESRTKF